MPRGRRAADPQDQIDQGNPSKRSKRSIDRAVIEAERFAQMLSDAPKEGDDYLAPPRFIDDPRLAHAVTVWKEYAPRLDRMNLLARTDRHLFALFCVYVAEFVQANDDVLKRGYSVMVPTIAKDANGKPGKMPRENPSVGRRDHAAEMMIELSVKFGLTPMDRAKLIRESAVRFDEETLFGRRRESAPIAADAEVAMPAPAPAPADGVGSMRRLDSPPPGSRPN
jgi:P27 family predicted phage terminase small subunit